MAEQPFAGPTQEMQDYAEDMLKDMSCPLEPDSDKKEDANNSELKETLQDEIV